jgi:CSLREA domain-containing protein
VSAPRVRLFRRALVCAIALAACAPVSAQATTFTVTSNNLADDGACDVAHCSLPEAIKTANGDATADINFNAGMTITVAAGGYLSIQFTGYEAANMRGEQTDKQLP